MPQVKPAAVLSVAAIAICGCGSAVKPPQGRGKVDDPRIYPSANHLTCLKKDKLPVQKVGSNGLQIGALPAGPTVAYQPSPGAAQAQQIEGGAAAQSAEVIGSALLYTHQAPDSELKLIETCLGQGVSG
jgi:hypothetical protein